MTGTTVQSSRRAGRRGSRFASPHQPSPDPPAEYAPRRPAASPRDDALRGRPLLLVGSRAMSRTLILVKPDAFARGLTGEIIARFERKGLTIAALQHMTLDEVTAKTHYA